MIDKPTSNKDNAGISSDSIDESAKNLQQGSAGCSALALVRPELLVREAYVPGLPEKRLIRLHANENPWSIEDVETSEDGLQRAVEKISQAGLSKTAATASNASHYTAAESENRELNRYPDPRPAELVAAMASYYEVNEDYILPVRGSDDAIDLLTRAFCSAGKDSILISSPTFGMYAAFAEIQGANIVDVPLLLRDNKFSFDLDKLAVNSAQSKLVYICSPNNPSGNSLSRDQIVSLCQQLDGRAIVVADEAYIEFSAHQSCASLIAEHDNLVVLRTLSKAFGAAGLRMGAVLAHPDLIRVLQSISTPYALSTPVIELALQGLQQQSLSAVQSRCQFLLEHRLQLAEALATHTLVETVFDSDANFLLVKFRDSELVAKTLMDNGILVRNFSQAPGCENCLRITIGREEENRKLLTVLDRIQGSATSEQLS